ncbi:MAG: ribosome biogenesis GTPase YlqF [Ruminococcaceae bacterium]|nr:ribosome biogenesis GTPase YlqF [Oscillospiraceae bacterium]
MNIQWFPGHMTKTMRLIEENIKLVDIVVEILDARLPKSSKNPEIDNLIKDKPRLILLNKSDIADANETSKWINKFEKDGISAIAISSTSGKSLNIVLDKCKEVLKDKIESWKKRGIVNRSVKIMVVGVPNVGKSSFINKIANKKSAKVGDKPGVTRGKQWIRLDKGFEMLDTPGVLWPKFDDMEVGIKLAFTGAVKDEIMDVELLSMKLLEFLKENYPSSLTERYKMCDFDNLDGYEMLTLLGKKRGFVISGGEIDTLRAANILLDEFRGAKLGRITLDKA